MVDVASHYEPWVRETPGPVLDCFLPTGIYLPMNLDKNLTLANLKASLWREALKYPLHSRLEQAAQYVFVGITPDAPFVQEFYDESRRVGDLRLFLPLLRLKETEGNREEKETSNHISEVCGISVADFNNSTDQEAIEYRTNLLLITKDVVEFREKGGKKALASYFYPSQLESDKTYEKDFNSLEGDVEFTLVPPTSRKEISFKVHVNSRDMPNDVVFRCLQNASHVLMDPLSPENPQSFPERNYENFVLKVCGRESYFLNQNHPFIQYKYIRNNLAHKRPIRLTLVFRDKLYSALDPSLMTLPVIVKRHPPPTTSRTPTTISSERPFRVKPTGIMNLNPGTAEKFFVRIGVFHGTEPLCPFLDTPPVSPTNPKWNDWMQFALTIQNIPRAAKLCMAVCASVLRKRRDRSIDRQPPGSASKGSPAPRNSRRDPILQDHIALAWANINIFNARGDLITDQTTVAMWPTPKDFVSILNPCGQTGSNSNHLLSGGHLTLRFDQINVTYPPHSKMLELAAITPAYKERSGSPSKEPKLTAKDSAAIKALAQRDPLYELTEQEKELLFRCRYSCVEVPECLPKLLSAVCWGNRNEVADVYAIIVQWPVLPPVIALELLDCKYPDPDVRKFAVRCLDKSCSDTELERYLLQMAQVLKYEPYLSSPIADFLLRRGLQNRRIGHVVFWLLKAEMYDESVSLRFGCILEALCRGSGAYTKALGRQVVALNHLKSLSELVIHKDEGKHFVAEQLKLEENIDSLQCLSSPLDCDDTLGNLIPSECKVLASAKRPLWLAWNNPDPLADLYCKKHEIICKNGDDLRQDMLTLQVLSLMDNIWQTEGLNLKLIPYGCLPTGKNWGVIEVVRNSKTVMAIQKLKGGVKAAMQVDNTALLKWLLEKNPDRISRARAIDNFTCSCAGYCVATFILGIGDRHPDNIMINVLGQMFHIDFGHFLGHFKKKFGISRERVPFVLTLDFIYVITSGAANPGKTVEYEQFKKLCCKAYGIMRKHANLIITLFTMLLSTGIAELQSLEDVAYLRNTLAVDKTEEEALVFFEEKMSEAYVDAWTTKVDWFFHGVRHMSYA